MEFIRLENTLEKAMAYKSSPDDKFFSFRGIQLLPNNDYPIIQTTNNIEGVELEDFAEVNVISMCGEVLENITAYFEVIDNFQDPETGLPQITWKILPNIPFDFGNQLIYLEIKQLVGETFYTNPFAITSEGSEFTSRIDYREKYSDVMQSINACLYYYDFDVQKEYSQYWEVSTKRTRTNTIKSQSFDIYRTQIIDKYILEKIVNIFDFKYTYLNLIRVNIFEVVEIPRKEGFENFVQTDISFNFDESEIYNPNYVVPIPPDPPVPEISLLITDVNKTQAYGEYNVYFDKIGFSPTYLSVQISKSGEPYYNNTASADSPRMFNFGNPNTLVQYTYYKVRMNHEGTDTTSNIATINLGANFWLTIQKKVSDTQYSLRIRYVIRQQNEPDILLRITNEDTNVIQNFTVPNTGVIDQIFNGEAGDNLNIKLIGNNIDTLVMFVKLE